jgi:TrkA domain protein
MRVSEIEETELPGVGTRFDFATRSGERIGVLVHRSGRRDLLLYDRDDPDACRSTVALDETDAHTLSELLGGVRLLEHLDEVRQGVEGLTIEWLRVEPSARLASSTLADAAIHTTTGVSIVAIVRGPEVIVSPGADERLQPDDLVVAVGTAEGVEEVAVALRGT